MKLLARIASVLLLLVTHPAVAEDEEWPETELIHSDLPIFADAGDAKMWPQHFSEGEGKDWVFGCMSRVAFGDWELTGDWPEDEQITGWFRFQNYGAFHCYANFYEAYEREELGEGKFNSGFFVEIGSINIEGRKRELWVIQEGMRPGSDYLLLARDAGGEGTIKAFDLLQRKCPRGNVRDAGNIDIAYTRYCSINSRSELVSLAKRMARLKPIGSIALVPNEKGPDEMPGPSDSD